MRVVQIDSVYEYSSTGRTTAEMHTYLKENGIDSYVFCTNLSDPKEKIFKFSNKLDMKIHAFLSRLLGLQGMFSYFSTRKLVNKLKGISPNIVHLRVLHSNCINLPLLLKYLAKYDIPTVVTLHDCWFITGHCCHFIDSNCNSWKHFCGNCPQIKKWNTSFFFDNSDKLLVMKKELFGNIKRLGVVGVSNWVTDFIKDSILKDAKIVKRIYNWIDCSKFTPRDIDKVRQSIGLSRFDFVILGVAKSWTKEKGIEEFITLAHRCPDFKFVLLGKLNCENLPPNVISLGSITNVNRIIDMYSMADVFFNPSYRETFGKVTLESIASGTPVVAYNVTATPEIVAEGCGYLINIGDIDEAVKCFNLIKSKTKSSYTKDCRLHAETNFLKESIIKEYITLYEQLQSTK